MPGSLPGVPMERGVLGGASLGSRSGGDSLSMGLGSPQMPTHLHQHSRAGKGLTPVQDPTPAPLPSYAAA